MKLISHSQTPVLSRSHMPKEITVNSLMFAGIYVCIFETKQCSRGIIFAV